MSEWQLQDAKNRFSAVVDAALAGEPQLVTRRGVPVVVVLANDEYERFRRFDRLVGTSLPDLLLNMPPDTRQSLRDLVLEL